MLVINRNSAESLEIGEYYAEKRGIPASNIVRVACRSEDNLPNEEFGSQLVNPVRQAIDAAPGRIDYIVTTKGVPLRIDNDGGWSVDAHLATMRMSLKPIVRPEADQILAAQSPYFNKREPFDSSKFGFYIVTRLDGHTVRDVRKLVDSALAARPNKGVFLFDQASDKAEGGFGDLQEAMAKAAQGLKAKGFTVTLDSGPEFAHPPDPLAGYVSWGSNDGRFSLAAYRSLRFAPGALAETFVSTSGRTFRPVDGGQSLIADLVSQGVTGVKGYVSEPYTFALARPEILFDRYTSGFTLGESFAMASPVLKWKDVVVGDPLCAPYAAP
jgi:uncharacterized protein (TIGR03790 family)